MKRNRGFTAFLTIFGCFLGLNVDVAAGASNITYEEAFKILKDGNKRFVLGISKYPRQTAARRQQSVIKGQKPFATILASSDSREVVELLFDQGIGDLFVVRVLGNVVKGDQAGSIEYGVDHLNTPICVVMGHTHCSAVTAVANGTELHGNIPQLLAPIIPAVAKARQKHPHAYGEDFIEHAVVENVWQSVEDLLTISEVTRKRILDGRLKVIGAIYELETGKVDWLGEHPQQAKILGDVGKRHHSDTNSMGHQSGHSARPTSKPTHSHSSDGHGEHSSHGHEEHHEEHASHSGGSHSETETSHVARNESIQLQMNKKRH